MFVTSKHCDLFGQHFKKRVTTCDMDESTEKSENTLKLTELSPKDWEKVSRDLVFVGLMTSLAKSLGYRVVISGGYSIDGNLSRITRPHNDIDIEIYGNNPQPQMVQELIEKIKDQGQFSELELDDNGRQEFYHSFFIEGNGLGADIYYVQVADNPFADTKVVVKKDGSLTSSHAFNTRQVSLNGIVFEAVCPREQLDDILKKRQSGKDLKSKHEQDVENLKTLLGRS